MPQLDVLTFFPQFLWTSIIFLVFYILIVQKILPKIAFILKTRALMNNSTNFEDEPSFSLSSFENGSKSLVIPSNRKPLSSLFSTLNFSNYFVSLTSILKKQSLESNNTFISSSIIVLFKGLRTQPLTSSSDEPSIKKDKSSKKKQSKSSKKTK